MTSGGSLNNPTYSTVNKKKTMPKTNTKKCNLGEIANYGLSARIINAEKLRDFPAKIKWRAAARKMQHISNDRWLDEQHVTHCDWLA
jgi:hypothetical protein